MSTIDLGIEHLSDAVVIGRGGFATVYAATNDLLGTRVAVKVLAPLTSEGDRRRFERECRVMGRVSVHPSVVTVYHAGYSADGRPYLVMELVEGGSLADRLRTGGPLPWPEAVDHAIAVAEALGLAHADGILHRDVKPENILLADGKPRLTDFGIAYLRDSTAATSTRISASWLHSPPETFGNQRDERSDLYSLGSTLYQLVVGHAPFWREGEDSLNPLLYRLMHEPPPPLPAELGPVALDAFLQRCLAKEPADRPASAAVCVAELRAVRDGAGEAVVPPVTTGAPPVPGVPVVAASLAPVTVAAPGEPVPRSPGRVQVRDDVAPARRKRRWPVLAGLGVLAVVALTAVFLVLVPRGGESPFEVTDRTVVFQGHRDGVVGLARLPDGRILSAGNDYTVQLWDADRREDPVVFEGHDNWVRSVVALGEERFVSGGEDGTARVWDAQRPGQAATVFDGHGASVATVSVLGDGSIASGGEDGTVQVWDPDTAAVQGMLDIGGAVRVVLGLDGRALVAAGTQGTIEQWDDPSGGEPSRIYEGHASSVNGLALTGDGRLVSVADDAMVRIWSLTGSTEPMGEHLHDEEIDSVAVRPDGTIVFGDRSGTVVIWDPETGEVSETELGSRVRAVLALPDGRVVAGTGAGAVHVWQP